MKEVFHLIIRVPKDQAAFTYFTLEANENICFYSTIDSSINEGFRDIDIQTSLDLKNELQRIITQLQKDFPLSILKEEILPDQ